MNSLRFSFQICGDLSFEVRGRKRERERERERSKSKCSRKASVCGGKNTNMLSRLLSSHFPIIVCSALFLQPWNIFGFTTRSPSLGSGRSTHDRQQPKQNVQPSLCSSSSRLFLRTNIEVPILDVLDKQQQTEKEGGEGESESQVMICPLPSSHLPDPVLATPFVYGMQLDVPIHKLLIEEATQSISISDVNDDPPMYGHLIWKNKDSENPLIGAIGCTAQILVNAPTTEVFNEQIAMDLSEEDEVPSSSEENTPSNTVLCRGGFRFVIKEVIKTIPYPVAIIDEIEDDDDIGDDDVFASFNTDDDDEDEDDDDDDDDDKYMDMSVPELIKAIMEGVQFIIRGKIDKVSNKQMSPLEQSILEDSGVSSGIDPNMIERMQIEEMAASWEVFQMALVDDIEPKDRKFAVAMMAVELADLKNDIRQRVMITRNSEERLRIVLRELDEIVGMERARKMATQITDDADEDSRDLKVGTSTLPQWAKTIRIGSRVEYFWNEEFGWVAGEVIEEPQTIVDEILLTIRFDDGELHTIPLTADEKVRWRPG